MLFKWILRHTEHIYCRDFEWIKKLKEFWFSKASFFMDTSYFARDNWGKYKKQKTKKYIVVNINKNGVMFMNDLKITMKEYENQKYKYYFIPVSNWWNDTDNQNILNKRLIPDYLKNTENDLKYLPDLKKDFPKIEIYDWTEDLENFFYFLGWAELVISPRLHLYLISSFIWVKTKVYPYQRKILKMQEVLRNLEGVIRDVE